MEIQDTVFGGALAEKLSNNHNFNERGFKEQFWHLSTFMMYNVVDALS